MVTTRCAFEILWEISVSKQELEESRDFMPRGAHDMTSRSKNRQGRGDYHARNICSIIKIWQGTNFSEDKAS